MNNKTITTKKTKAIGWKEEEEILTYSEIREIFRGDDDCLVIQLLNRVEELEEKLEMIKSALSSVSL